MALPEMRDTLSGIELLRQDRALAVIPLPVLQRDADPLARRASELS